MIRAYLALEGGCIPRMIAEAYPEIGSNVDLHNFGIVKITELSYIKSDNWVEFELNGEVRQVRIRISEQED
jgi:hypothetical protein